ncbi:MAG: hypothetical protein JOZ16_06870 [Methylobacteriaceae bacterium]|nr:hypothetical protein [Methylobacteriaceae bacterium]
MSRYKIAALAAVAFVACAPGAAQAGLEATCPSVSYRGPIIVATCYTAMMTLNRSAIDTRGCLGEPGNLNGTLVCDRGGGGYGHPGYGGPPGYGAKGWYGRPY